MPDSVRVGIVGTSWWSDFMFLPSFKSHPSAEIAAICGRNRDRAEEVARKHDVPLVFTDYRKLIDSGELDAVVVSTPDDLHHEMTMAALDAGLHVLCEKPMALNAHHAKEMLEKANAVGVKHMVLFTWRWQPHFRYLKQLVDEGYIGRCYHAQFRFLAGFGRQPAYQWRVDSRRSNGVVSDLGAHMIDFARWYVGDISQVCAHLAAFVEHPNPEGGSTYNNDSAIVNLAYENGAQGIIQVSVLAHQETSIEVVLHGESGTLEAKHVFSGPEAGAVIRGMCRDDPHFTRLTVPAELRQNLTEGGDMEPYAKQSVGPRLFIDAILADRPVSPDFLDGLEVQKVIDAALESHRIGCWVSLS